MTHLGRMHLSFSVNHSIELTGTRVKLSSRYDNLFLDEYKKRSGKRDDNRRKAMLVSLLTVLFLATILTSYNLIVQTENPTNVESYRATFIMPLKTIDDKVFTISQLLRQEKPVMLYFFSPTCEICKVDMKALSKVYQQFEGRINVVMVNVGGEIPQEEVENYIAQYGAFDWIIVADPNINFVVSLGISRIPVVIVFSEDGDMLYRRDSGSLSAEEWKNLLEKLTSR